MTTLSVTTSPQHALAPFENMRKGDYFNTITTVAASALFVVALALTVHYSVHPTGNLVPIGHLFTVRLPLVVMIPTGLSFAVFFIVQVCRKEVTRSFERGFGQTVYSISILQKLIRFILHPNGREKGETANDYLMTHSSRISMMIRFLGGESVATVEVLSTDDGLNLRGIWYYEPKNTRTVVLLHGNGENAEDCLFLAGFYKEQGFNVLIPEYRGYGMSEGEAAGEDHEQEALLDCGAIYKFLEKKKVDLDHVAAHGYSLGGYYATALGYFFDIKKIVLDHAFTTYAAVVVNVCKSYGCSSSTIGSWENMISASKKPGKVEIALADGKKICLETNNWNNVARTSEMKERIFVIQGEKDKLMGKIAEEFLEPSEKANRFVTVQGGHTDGYLFGRDKKAVSSLIAFFG